MTKKMIIAVFLLFLSSYSTVLAESLFLVTLESPPAEYIENGQPKGINVEIVTESLKRMGYDCRIQFYPWKRALNMVRNGTADGIIDAAYSKERAEFLHYPSEEIYIEKWYCFKRKNSDLTLDENLANAGEISFGVSRGFVYGGLIQEAIDKKLFRSIEEVSNNELNIQKLVKKRFDMFVGVKATILFLAKKTGLADRIEIVKMTGTDKDYLLSSSKTYLGFSKIRIQKEFVDKYSKTLAEMKKDGTVSKIAMKYY